LARSIKIGLRDPGRIERSVKRKLRDERNPSKYQSELFSESALVLSIVLK